MSSPLEMTEAGVWLAQGSLLATAIVPIFVGAFRSVKSLREQLTSTGKVPKRMTQTEAAMNPLICSCVLFGLYILLKLFSKEHVSLLLSVPITVLIVDDLAHKISPLINKLMKPLTILLGASHYHLYFLSTNNKDGNTMKKIFAWDFTCTDLLAWSAGIGVWYLTQKHWLANNLMVTALAIISIEQDHLNKVKTGCIMMGGLFFYDIFWVFTTDVMTTVVMSLDAPMKL